ncbi:MAG: hydroxymethylglutaryl-CoA lyase [Granulosicoccus sp.]|nr:hydroxymethylglutaryl-CoA lyase [Granulosicoccus sp.]
MSTVRIYEVGPRDGLQNETRFVPTADKITLIDQLSSIGFTHIETTSFVSPKWVPQMADAGDVLSGITRQEDLTYAALTPNIKGFDRAREAKVNEVAIFAAASEGFSQKNTNCSIEQGLERFAPVASKALEYGMTVRGYISCVTDCPYDGKVAPESVAYLVEKLLKLGCYEISLGDTTGAATPESTDSLLKACSSVAPSDKLAGHFHDTFGHALDNIDVCLEHKLRTFDASVAGLGGCPYSPGAKGNVATERVVQHVEAKGHTTGLDKTKLQIAADFAKTLVSSA